MLNTAEPWSARLISSIQDSLWNITWMDIETNDSDLVFTCSMSSNTHELECVIFKRQINTEERTSTEIPTINEESTRKVTVTTNDLFAYAERTTTENQTKSVEPVKAYEPNTTEKQSKTEEQTTTEESNIIKDSTHQLSAQNKGKHF